MDLAHRNFDQFKELLGSRRAKAIFVGILILIVVVLMQVGNLRKNIPMCELLNDCRLRTPDLHRMQIALGKSGLSEFSIEDHRLLVPKSKHATYLQAVVEHDAIPPELKSNKPSGSIANPLLSFSQQRSIQQEAKKRQIQEMIVRLPFVEQAWFDMDIPESRSAFSHTAKSAVVSIRPTESSPLLQPQVGTLRQMIGGAIAGIDPNQIVVIDLSTGFAHQHGASSPGDQRQTAQQVAFARQQILESRIRQALSKYPGLRVTVVVEPSENRHQLAKTAIADRQVRKIPSATTAGANGQASIFPYPVTGDSDGQVVHASHAASDHEKVNVMVDVPEELIEAIYGQLPDVPADFPAEHGSNDVIENNFAQLKTEIERIVRPLIGGQSESQQAILFNLIRKPVSPASHWAEKLKAYWEENWPSAAVLLIGITLILLITQSGKSAPRATNSPTSEPDVLAFSSAAEQEGEAEVKRNAEVRLSKLIEKDPDAAAKVIENWIRDAA